MIEKKKIKNQKSKKSLVRNPNKKQHFPMVVFILNNCILYICMHFCFNFYSWTWILWLNMNLNVDYLEIMIWYVVYLFFFFFFILDTSLYLILHNVYSIIYSNYSIYKNVHWNTYEMIIKRFYIWLTDVHHQVFYQEF